MASDDSRRAARDVWMIFADELESSLLREVEYAFRRASGSGASEA